MCVRLASVSEHMCSRLTNSVCVCVCMLLLLSRQYVAPMIFGTGEKKMAQPHSTRSGHLGFCGTEMLLKKLLPG